MSVHGENGPTIRISSPLSVPSRPGIPVYKSRQRVGRVPTRRHVSCSSGPSLPAKLDSGATTCPVAPDLTSQRGRALVLPRVQWLRTPPHSEGGLRYCHVSSGTGSCLPTREGFGTTTKITTLYPCLLLQRAPAVPRSLRSPEGCGPQA
jgi:hypothetical protein